MSSMSPATNPFMQLPSLLRGLQHCSRLNGRDGKAVSQSAGLTNRILEQPPKFVMTTLASWGPTPQKTSTNETFGFVSHVRRLT